MKALTRAHNHRQRLKREHEKIQSQAGGLISTTTVAPKALSTTNTVPLAPLGATADPASVLLPPSPPSKPPHKKARIGPDVPGDVDDDALLTHAKAAALAVLESSTGAGAGASTNVSTSTSARAMPTLGTHNANANATPEQQELMMLSMRNKNEKKGFWLSMAQSISQKIVFGESDDVESWVEAVAAGVEVEVETELQSEVEFEVLLVKEPGTSTPNQNLTSRASYSPV